MSARRPSDWLWFLTPAVVGLALDLYTKWLAFDRLVVARYLVDGREEVQGSVVTVLPGWLHLTALTNHGGALGLGAGLRWAFLGFSVLAVGLLVWFFLNSAGRRGYQLVLGLLMAGVIGNAYDRLVHGFVRDMIHALPGRQWSDLVGSLPNRDIFPWVFNVADMFLCVGVAVVIVWYGLISPNPEGDEKPTAEPA